MAAETQPVAVVGLGGLFPQARNVREFWSNIVAARDCIESVPESHWRIGDHYDPDPKAPDKTYCKVGGFVPTIDFDPMEFGIPPTVLEVTDTVQLLSLTVAKQTFLDAGAFDSDWYDASRAGVVLGTIGGAAISEGFNARLVTPQIREAVLACGLSERDAAEIVAKYSSAFAPWEENSFPGALGNVIAGRIANRFDLGGTNFVVDSACASSLTAVRLAVDELLSGRADFMLTGGAEFKNTIFNYLCFSKTPAFSREGRVRPFDESADGTLSGEGIGMLALKRLDDAERDGNRIYAVLRAIGSSSDGRFKSIYAPRREGQVNALHRAYAEAGFDADQVGLVECHGTGTSVGDAIEVSALREVFEAAGSGPRAVALGSVKSQIGHTKAAAGVAGMIKAVLALHERVLPPTINVDRPHGSFDGSPFYVNTAARPWILDPNRTRRRAAVSAFGFGGTNFHCVLEEYDGATVPVSHAVSAVYVWHAATAAELVRQLESGVGGGDPAEAVPDDHARLAIVASTPDELAALVAKAVERLRADTAAVEFTVDRAIFYRGRALRGGKVAALFAGQGSQYPDMGARAVMALPPLRLEFDTAALDFAGSEALGAVVFPPPAFDAAQRAEQDAALRRTEYAQPAIGALSAGQFKYLTELGFRADGAMGHSFGELTALWAAGSLTDAEFRRLAWERGAAMAARPADSADPGAMVAVACGIDRVRELLAGHPDVYLCNINAPDQVVLGGGSAAVSAFAASCAAVGITTRELSVATAFHTPYVAHAVESFRRAVAEVEIREPSIPVYPDMATAQYGPDVVANRESLVQQLMSTVYFSARIAQMYDHGFRVFVEFGPGTVLSGLVRKILADRDDVVVLSADGGRGSDSDRAIKQLAARLLVLGMPLTGINRYTAPLPPEQQAGRMRIPLNGANYIPPKRVEEHNRLLHNGYRASVVAANGSPAAEPAALLNIQSTIPVPSPAA